jgi:hypothetical protein
MLEDCGAIDIIHTHNKNWASAEDRAKRPAPRAASRSVAAKGETMSVSRKTGFLPGAGIFNRNFGGGER